MKYSSDPKYSNDPKYPNDQVISTWSLESLKRICFFASLPELDGVLFFSSGNECRLI